MHDLFDGINGTVLAYGQTGSGKTYTMGTGNPGQDDLPQDPHNYPLPHPSQSWSDAVLTRSIEAVFDQVAARRLSGHWSVNVAVSFSEVYMDKLYDLLEPASLEGIRRPCRPDTLRHPLVHDQESLQVGYASSIFCIASMLNSQLACLCCTGNCLDKLGLRLSCKCCHLLQSLKHVFQHVCKHLHAAYCMRTLAIKYSKNAA